MSLKCVHEDRPYGNKNVAPQGFTAVSIWYGCISKQIHAKNGVTKCILTSLLN